MSAYNIFHALLRFNLKPQVLARWAICDIVQMIQADYWAAIVPGHPP